ncbi:hypothetical protein [Enterobacter roggenkampii]
MNDTIKELVTTVKDTFISPVQEAFIYRARNPFFGSLVIAWMCYNWDKIAFLFFSTQPIEQRIHFIRVKIPDNSVLFGINIPHTHSYWIPLSIAIIFSLTFPFFTLFLTNVHRWVTERIQDKSIAREVYRIKQQQLIEDELHENQKKKEKNRLTIERLLADEKDSIASTKYRTEQRKAEFDELSRKIARAQEDFETLEKVTSSMSERRNDLQVKIEKFTKEYDSISATEKVIESLNNELSSLSIKLSETTKSLLTKEKEASNFNEEVKSLSSQLEHLKQKESNIKNTFNIFSNSLNKYLEFIEGEKSVSLLISDNHTVRTLKRDVSMNSSNLARSFEP